MAVPAKAARPRDFKLRHYLAEEEIDRFQSAVNYIEDGIRMMSLAIPPDQKRIEWWTKQVVKLKEQIAQEKAARDGGV